MSSLTTALPAQSSVSANVLNVYTANTFCQRLRGLLGRPQLGDDEALHIQPCSDVHSFGMSYPIDVVFLGDKGNVLDIKTLKPNRIALCKGAKSVVELREGAARQHGIELGSTLESMRSTVVKQSIGERV